MRDEIARQLDAKLPINPGGPSMPEDKRYVNQHGPVPAPPVTTLGVKHVEAARHIHLVALLLVGSLSLAAIATGIVALVLNSKGDTQLRLFGADLNTGNVGVACLGIGLISVVLVVRRVLKSVESLAALPSDRSAVTTRRGKRRQRK
jgi:hypothetical protein